MSASSFTRRYGPWALIAGASVGLGEQFARQLAERGLNLVLVARRGDLLRTLASDIARASEVEVRPLVLDLARQESLAEFERVSIELEVGLVVYNAAVSVVGSFLEKSIEDYRAELEVNCRRPLELVHLFAKPMAQRKRGGILLMSSLAGTQGSPFIAHYGATKAWNTVLAEGLWGELGEHGIDVLACRAGATRTPRYLKDRGEKTASSFVPEMEPRDVVTEALGALGSKPSFVPGRTNRLAAAFMQRLLPRSTAVRMMGRASRSAGVGPS